MNSPSLKKSNERELLEFLPAAIEVERTPASPLGRAVLWVIVALFVFALLWAAVGKVDIVAVAQGKIIPSERVKLIQPLETGIIAQIHIQEGAAVKAGQALITLQRTQTAADVERLSHELSERLLEVQRMRALERWLAGSRQNIERIEPSERSESAGSIIQQQFLLERQIEEIEDRIETLNHESARQQAERVMTQAEIEKKVQVIPVIRERVKALDTLQKKQFGSRLQYLELKQEQIEEEQDLAVRKARLVQLDASLRATQSQIDTLLSEQRKNNLAQLQQTEIQVSVLQQELIKANERHRQQVLRAPIDGHVQQLAVHTIGGVVTPAQTLMIIVPEQSRLEVEALVLNRDIGFVNEGQKAEVKIDTFNFTKYGLIDAQIVDLSEDAIQDENLGLVYTARLSLETENLVVENRTVRLSPGMSVTTEIKTGKRRLIEFFLSPLLRYKQESVRER